MLAAESLNEDYQDQSGKERADYLREEITAALRPTVLPGCHSREFGAYLLQNGNLERSKGKISETMYKDPVLRSFPYKIHHNAKYTCFCSPNLYKQNK